jgi:serine/threonine-protein kinase RsbW
MRWRCGRGRESQGPGPVPTGGACFLLTAGLLCANMPGGMLRQRFGRRLDALEGIFVFVAEFLASRGLPPSGAFELDLVIEELFTNMVKYSPEGAPEIEIQLEQSGLAVTAVLSDFDVEPFDVTCAPGADISRPLEERQTGGFGLRLVRRIADSLRYDYRDRISTITVTVTVRQ